MATPPVKRCTRCGETKPLIDFSRKRGGRDGRCSWCKVCKNAAQALYYQAHKAQRDAYAKRYYAAHVEAAREASRRRYRENPRYRRRDREREYGPGAAAWYDEQLARQDGRCALCGARSATKRSGLFLDHNHATGALRGLLCAACNIAVGSIGRDTPEFHRRVIAYLEQYENTREQAA